MRWPRLDHHDFTCHLTTWRRPPGWAREPGPAAVALLRADAKAAFAVVAVPPAGGGRAFRLADAPCAADRLAPGHMHHPESGWPLGHAPRLPRVAAWRALRGNAAIRARLRIAAGRADGPAQVR